MSGRLLIFITLAVLIGKPALAQHETLELRDFLVDEISYAGFILNEERQIHIEAVGAGGKKKITKNKSFQVDPNNMFAYAWILNSETREMVWRMTIDNTQKIPGSKFNRKFDGDVTLPAGTYEVYFSAFVPSFFNIDGGFISLKLLLKVLFEDPRGWDKDAEKWMVRITGVSETLDKFDVKKIQDSWIDRTVAHLIRQKDNRLEHTGFSLKQPAKLLIYAVGEGAYGKMYDYGWIINARTHERIWMMEENETEYAGGANKNRFFKTTLNFKAGDYLVYYKTDDSHSYEKWNANPPYDPVFWGIVVKPVSRDFDWKNVEKYVDESQSALISINRVGDYAYTEAFIKVLKPTPVRIFALGEGRNGDMYDYGWISRVSDGKVVWKMNYDETRHAGGSSKNRLFDGVITLQPGAYIIHYQTDDSHSYEEWNARPPQQPEMWGITLYNLGDKEAVRKIDQQELKPKKVLAQLVQVGDDEYLRKDFYLSKTSSIRIYCLGEGEWDEMYDYGWIKDVTTGQVVWKMRFKNTVHAGGANKNRMVNTIISLPAGHYRVYYRSDGSHSYRRWNASPPYDERNWGISVYLVE
ncbi:hypothetical protein ACX8XN_04090 [Calditrichota bacterium GD2]